ncbi:hypothetical protein VNO77_12172 [Canavalia gladiata]|uniref:Response regulatory domain-containing protein n=1 Tax=Canavalia gladiata TaxID=3824 RepID=A0AAN9QMN4_CANGL
MEDESPSLLNYVPTFARGFNLLLVHDDKSSLVYLTSLLELYSFKVIIVFGQSVTATDDTSAATSMICDPEGRFKLIMAKVNMPGINTVSFLDVVLQKDIPVILISSGGFDDVTRKALPTGLCYFLEEPIRSSDLKHVWRHLYRAKACSTKATQNAEFHTRVKHVHGANGERKHDDKRGKLKDKRTVDKHSMPGSWSSMQMNLYNNYHNNSVFAERKRAIVWTPELHLKFTQAIRMLGENNARPKQILTRMNEPYLTVRQVASHLQKHKLRLRRIENARNSVSASSSSSLSHKAQIPSPSEVSSLGAQGLPTPAASLNESKNEDQFPKLLETPGNSTPELTNGGSQSVDSSMDQMDQGQPATEYNDLIEMLMEDSDNYDLFEDETDPSEVDKYCEMLKIVMEGDMPVLPSEIWTAPIDAKD